MDKKVVILNDDLGTIALGFSRAGYGIKAIYIDEKEKGSIKVYKDNWNEQIFEVNWSEYRISDMEDADIYAGKIRFVGFSSAGRGNRKVENISQDVVKALEILNFKRPKEFMFRCNRISDRDESFRHFCTGVKTLGYQIGFNTVDINYLTGLPVKEKEYFIYGSLIKTDFNLKLLKETDSLNHMVKDIIEKDHIDDEWYYRLTPRYRIHIEGVVFPKVLCWNNNQYEEVEYVSWNPRMIPLVAVDNEVRKITHREVARLKGIPDNYYLDVSSKSWLYQKLMYSSNVLAIQQIASIFSDRRDFPIFENREVSKGLKFETIIQSYLKIKEVSLLDTGMGEGISADFRFTKETETFTLILKIYSGNTGIEKRIISACEKIMSNNFSDNSKVILVVGNVVKKETKKIAKEIYNVDIWDVENLLWMFEEFPQIISDFISILSFSVENIIPQEPDLEVFSKQAKKLYDSELQEALRKIEPGKEDAAKYEKLCIDIL
ncbi:DNA cytosine methyltransferase [Hespellia stercorisuis]|uniref:Site-specific DNA-cytosine methylase n=1 Tax=Hespellia stercorisuis DSM 15480 TaxID=1121950 RepID=A0A1M6WZF8_9FIRM|nr:DNA cytosine methyltransferase [Hespellia stercorisuis]SHK99066.1 Site-specific DNA-cytosine methylase [Hespellia stercorisuis DSM 15480]